MGVQTQPRAGIQFSILQVDMTFTWSPASIRQEFSPRGLCLDTPALNNLGSLQEVKDIEPWEHYLLTCLRFILVAK